MAHCPHCITEYDAVAPDGGCPHCGQPVIDGEGKPVSRSVAQLRLAADRLEEGIKKARPMGLSIALVSGLVAFPGIGQVSGGILLIAHLVLLRIYLCAPVLPGLSPLRRAISRWTIRLLILTLGSLIYVAINMAGPLSIIVNCAAFLGMTELARVYLLWQVGRERAGLGLDPIEKTAITVLSFLMTISMLAIGVLAWFIFSAWEYIWIHLVGLLDGWV